MAKSIEEKVEEYYKSVLDEYGIRHYAKTESINESISDALKKANSKSGGNGNNYPDIKLLLDNGKGRRIPVMIEAKGGNKKLEKLDNGEIVGVTTYTKDTVNHKAGDNNYSTVQNYAVNGAYHYGKAIIDNGDYKEVIVIGINGTELRDGKVINPECKAFYLSLKNNKFPKHIHELDNDFSLLKQSNIDKLYSILDKLNLTESEIEEITKKAESNLEEKIKDIHQRIYDNDILKTSLSTNEKLYLFSGLIMAGLPCNGIRPLEVSDFYSNDNKNENDSTIIIKRIETFLQQKKCSTELISLIMGWLSTVVGKEDLWKPRKGESILKNLFKQIKNEIIPLLTSGLHLDFTGKILNSLNDWVDIANDRQNDVVLTPRYITKFMAKLCRTNKDSFVWDRAMGSAGFLVSAMDLMIKDAKEKIVDEDELNAKIQSIKENQILGVEILENIYILAVLNMILMGDGSSNIIWANSHELNREFPATVFLLNPPYSADGKGFNFVEETLKVMTTGYSAILIQENAGSGQGLPYTKNILKNNTLLASIHMPDKLFCGKSCVQTAIYLFKVARPHELDDIVTFIDLSEDGYLRSSRKKSSQKINLRDTDDAIGRYAEIEAKLLGKHAKTNYYTEENGTIIKDTISMNGDDWTFKQHQIIDIVPTEEDFKNTVSDYLSWKISTALQKSANVENKKTPLPTNKEFKNFRMDSLFEIYSPKKRFNANNVRFGGKYPYVARGSLNNGIRGYITEDTKYLSPAKSLSFGQDTATVFYQELPYFTGDKIKVMVLKHRELTRHIAEYLISAIKKSFSTFVWGQSSFDESVIKSVEISLPVKEGSECEIDFDYMENYVKSLEKIVIKDVEDYKDKLISLTKQIVN